MLRKALNNGGDDVFDHTLHRWQVNNLYCRMDSDRFCMNCDHGVEPIRWLAKYEAGPCYHNIDYVRVDAHVLQ